ncbi:AI-2E family transporter [Patescibacteria group bacterium]|nr:AI-2E family transporter [Patescibacteria group bacterium]MCG2695015.1 AI-2E family transporter [Candidatus Parcubacteria bacterium]
MDKELTINITSGTIVKTILFVLLVVLLYFLKDLVLVILTAIVIASSVEPITKWFIQRKIPRLVAVILIYFSVAFLVAGLFFLLIPPLLDDASSLMATLPQYFEDIKLNTSLGTGIDTTFSLREFVSEFRDGITGATGSVLQTVSSIFGGAINFVLIIILSFYLAVQEFGIASFLRIITPVNKEKYIIDLWKRSQFKIGLWMQGQLLLALIIGVLVYLGLTILGIKYAFLFALLAAILELIPLFGPVIAAVPAIIVGFVDGGATLGFLVTGFYIIIQQFENHLIYPLVVKKVVGVPPLLVILALIIGAKLAGFLGILLSVPVAAALMEYVHDIEAEKKKLMQENS